MSLIDCFDNPPGSGIKNRRFSNEYRYGFNGIEIDNDISGEDNCYFAYYRAYNPRLGVWFSRDPDGDYPDNFALYVGMDDSPIWHSDQLGDRVVYANMKTFFKVMRSVLTNPAFRAVWNQQRRASRTTWSNAYPGGGQAQQTTYDQTFYYKYSSSSNNTIMAAANNAQAQFAAIPPGQNSATNARIQVTFNTPKTENFNKIGLGWGQDDQGNEIQWAGGKNKKWTSKHSYQAGTLNIRFGPWPNFDPNGDEIRIRFGNRTLALPTGPGTRTTGQPRGWFLVQGSPPISLALPFNNPRRSKLTVEIRGTPTAGEKRPGAYGINVTVRGM